MGEHVVIIGAGVIGLTSALYLQAKGRQVTLIDKAQPGQGCSSGNAGHFATQLVMPLSSLSMIPEIPRMLLDPKGPLAIRPGYFPKALPWLCRFMSHVRPSSQRHIAGQLNLLNKAAMAAWQPLFERTNAKHLIRHEGALLAFETAKAYQQADAFHAWQATTYDVPYQRWSRNEIEEREPGLAASIRHAIYYPETHFTLDPLRLSQTLFSHFTREGGRFIQQEVQSATVEEAGVMINGVIQADQLVIALGAHSKPWIKQLTGVSIPLESERGYHLMLPDEGHVFHRPVTFAEKRFVLTPMQDGLRLAGTVEFAGLQRLPDMARATMLKSLITPLMASRPGRSGQLWMGHRPTLSDSLPIIDRVGPQGRVLVAVGHQHLGLTLAGITGKLISELACDDQTTLPTAAFRLKRF
ncbi:NAD(P)/FAD-dependent oxidoreductase [Pokkaliibacter sp. CJK22405]|uniref:NAD(P)/FAD-dependent oxidoreductase n=1 Tax=Pokkaliibacter sp. CJK22405 TaxID=3384615 RepID=UPI003984973A